MEERPTLTLEAIEKPTWPIAIATLEQLGSWAVLALRLGTLALLQECTRAMAQPDAPVALVGEAQSLIDALRHMPWES
jgi:hypothetical protein